LTQEDYEKLSSTNSIIAQKVEEKDSEGKVEVRWMLTDIIGQEDGLGVENLRGSGMIAGETSKAYEDIFTITLVTGRTGKK